MNVYQAIADVMAELSKEGITDIVFMRRFC